MHLTFLGTGPEAGIPVFGCACVVCARARFDKAARRRPGPCLVLEAADTRLLLGACPGVPGERLGDRRPREAVLLPHWKAGAIHALYALRWGAGGRIPVFGPALPLSCSDLVQEPGILDLTPLAPLERRPLGPFALMALPLADGRGFGYALESATLRLVWLGTGAALAPEALTALGPWQPDVLVTASPWGEGPVSPLEEEGLMRPVQELSERLGALRTLVSGVGHRLDRLRESRPNLLPPGVEFARDGQRIDLREAVFTLPLLQGCQSGA